MKRFLIAVFAFLTISGLLTGCGRFSDIGKDKAAEIALTDAGLTEAEVTRLRVSKDSDDGQTIYEIKFTNETTEYEYEILASSGEILSADYEESFAADPQLPDTQQEQAGQPNPAGQQGQPEVQLSLEDASELALSRVPGASVQDLKIELDYDDGRCKYEGDIIYDQKEYEFEIDADTGDFLEWKEERR